MSPRTFPTSFAQSRLWFLDQLEPGTAAYNLPRAFRIIGPLDLDLLRRALDTVTRRHASLRTTFESDHGKPRQVVWPESNVHVPLVDLINLPENERETEALRIVGEEGRKPFDLGEGPLLRSLVVRLGPERHIFLMVMHHIITDGWSISILFREVTSCYAAFVRGEEPDLPDLSVQYVEYAQWQNESMSGEGLTRQIEHWKSKLAGAQSQIDLPLDHPRPTKATWHGATEEISLDGITLAKLKAIAQAERATPFMVAMAAFQTLLWRYTHQESVLVGTPVAARSEVEFENMVGLFANTLVFRSDFSLSLTFRELIRQVRAFALDAYMHQEVPFEKLVEVLVPQRSLDTHPLFQVMFTFQNIPKQVFEIPGLSIKEIAFEAGIAKFDLSVEVWEDHEFHCQFEYRNDLFEQSTIRRMLGHFQKLLRGALDSPDQRLAELSLMGEQERSQVQVEWNRTAADYFRELTIHRAFEQQVGRTPDATALISDGTRWTYRHINDEANRLAHLLVRKGIGAGCLIGILLDRSVEMIVALLGVLKTGAAYIPLDRAYPTDRIRLMLKDAAASGVITVSAFKDRLPTETSNVVELDNHEELRCGPSTDLSISVSSEEIAYVIYTSGSTGAPKGVEGTHRASMNRFAWMWRTYPFVAGEVCCQKTNLTFVDSIWEIFGPLLAGIPSVIIPQEAVLDPELLLQALADQRVTRIVVVPSQLRSLLEIAPNLQQRVPELKLWSCSGEVLPGDLARRFHAAFPCATMLNIYGASEVAADATCHEVSEQDLCSVPIGKPISNTQVYLVDECSNAVPIGIRGEIYIGGEGLARGYLNRPKLTAERFVRNWMVPEQYARLYRTGDLGRWRGDGEIEYLGRVDSQIKLRGQRIELGEIESVLASHVAVGEAVVAVSGEADQQKLTAYLVSKAGMAVPDTGELRRYLRGKLPEHMVPASYWQVEKVPLLPSGKVDRAALDGCERRRLVDGRDWEGPRNESEARLAEIWRELLKLERVGREQNFFELGGHSLLVLQLTARVRRTLDVELPVRSVFESPTIASLAGEVEKARGLGLKARSPVLRRRQRAAADPNREELLAKLNSLSHAELQSVLQRVLEGKESARGSKR